MQVKLLVSALAMAALIAIVAGCGGSDDSAGADDSSGSKPANTSPPATTSSLSRADLFKQVNANCARLRGDRLRGFRSYIDNYQPKKGETGSDVRVKAIRVIAIPTLKAQTEQLRELGAPRGDEKQVGEIYAAFERANKAGAHMETMATRAEVDRSFRQASQMAKKYGFYECVVYSPASGKPPAGLDPPAQQ